MKKLKLSSVVPKPVNSRPLYSFHVEESVISFSDTVSDLRFFLDKILLKTNPISSAIV